MQACSANSNSALNVYEKELARINFVYEYFLPQIRDKLFAIKYKPPRYEYLNLEHLFFYVQYNYASSIVSRLRIQQNTTAAL